MRFTKKAAVAALAVSLFTLGSSAAMAQRGGGDGDGGGGGGGGDGDGRGKVTICHRTSSERNPWELIRVSENALDAHERHGDTFPDDGNCPGDDIPDQDGNGDGDGGGNGGGGHDGNGGGGHDHDHDGEFEASRDCSTSQDNASNNSTGDTVQSGLININNIALQGLNLDILGNLLCQADFLNDIVASVLGTAVGDSDRGHDGHGDDDHDRFGVQAAQGESGLLGGVLGGDGLVGGVLGGDGLVGGVLGGGLLSNVLGGGGLLGGAFGGDSVLSSLGVLF